MKVRLTQPGFENYTGQMGVIFFVDGLSTDDVSSMDARRLSAVMSCEAEDGSNISLTQDLIDKNNDEAPVVPELQRGNDTVPEMEQGVALIEEEGDEVESPEGPKVYTQAELEAIADAEGIKGIRAIAEPLGIKNNSIAGLINELVKGGFAVATAAASE